jgi:hypothetical protein
MEERRWSFKYLLKDDFIKLLPDPAYTHRAGVVQDMRKSSVFNTKDFQILNVRLPKLNPGVPVPEKQDAESVKWNVSLAQLTLAVVWVLLGAAVTELVRNIAGAETVSFSTTELVGFVLSVVLSAASIVLAIAAIWLGKISELSMVRRSDESIRMQNEVYIRTTEALNRIESSTGVTEKRIEDIIAGRAGDISHKIAELTTGKGGLSGDRDAIEKEIKRIIEGNESSKYDEIRQQRRAAMLAKQERYKRFHQSVLTAFANKSGLVAKKLGDGRFDSEGVDLFDVVATLAGKVIGASAFEAETDLATPRFTEYLMRIAQAIHSDVVSHVYIAINASSEKAKEIQDAFNKTLTTFRGDLNQKISLLLSEEGEIEKRIADIAVE